jgi:hypothetical protein
MRSSSSGNADSTWDAMNVSVVETEEPVAVQDQVKKPRIRIVEEVLMQTAVHHSHSNSRVAKYARSKTLGPPLGTAPRASVADPTPTTATATAHRENQDHHSGDDGRDSNPEQGSTKNTLHDRHPSLGCPHQAGSTFTPWLPAPAADQISTGPASTWAAH